MGQIQNNTEVCKLLGESPVKKFLLKCGGVRERQLWNLRMGLFYF